MFLLTPACRTQVPRYDGNQLAKFRGYGSAADTRFSPYARIETSLKCCIYYSFSCPLLVGQVPWLRFSSTHTLPKRFSPNACDPESPNRENLSTRLKTFLGAKWRRFMASLAMDGIGLPSLPKHDTLYQHQSSYLELVV